jgi:hypothetical protein
VVLEVGEGGQDTVVDGGRGDERARDGGTGDLTGVFGSSMECDGPQWSVGKRYCGREAFAASVVNQAYSSMLLSDMRARKGLAEKREG